jgi:hypothetical protein
MTRDYSPTLQRLKPKRSVYLHFAGWRFGKWLLSEIARAMLVRLCHMAALRPLRT